jgi:DHA1 family tetracycline resistance protein-like MFS transporter
MNARRALLFIFFTVMLDVLALGLMIPVLPKLVLSFMGGDTAGAAKVFGLFATVWGAMQFICSPLLGAMSDRLGRRPIILISCLGLGLDYIFMAMAPSLTLLFVGRVISGITAATITTSFAYIADVTPHENRARAFGIVGIAFSVGFILGPAAGGLLGSVDPRLPFWASAAACLANAAFGWFVLPESLPTERRMPFAWARANPIGSFRLLSRHLQLIGLAAAGFLGQFAHQVLPSIFVLYAGYRYGYGESMVGLTLGFVGVCSGIVQGLLIGPAVKHFGERATLVIGLLAGALGMAIYGLAPTGPLFWIGIPVMALWGLSGPATMAIMSRLVSPSEQGQLSGANTSLGSIAGLVAPGVFALSFAHSLRDLPGAPFLLAAATLLVAGIIAWAVTAPRPADDLAG